MPINQGIEFESSDILIKADLGVVFRADESFRIFLDDLIDRACEVQESIHNNHYRDEDELIEDISSLLSVQ